jgi:hypothetical protein
MDYAVALCLCAGQGARGTDAYFKIFHGKKPRNIPGSVTWFVWGFSAFDDHVCLSLTNIKISCTSFPHFKNKNKFCD